jgi:hypothetical protein
MITANKLHPVYPELPDRPAQTRAANIAAARANTPEG